MLIQQAYKSTANAKQHARLKGAFRRFQKAMKRISVREVNAEWYMASSNGLVSFGCTAEIARAKCEAALRNQLLSGLRVVGERTRERVAA